ncbi:MAG: GNVR domain-containing protein [Candidatus Omnitrophota bacterium]|nr:GNVR domain-containing protein [Candidatus Omnitrophota bacterium]
MEHTENITSMLPINYVKIFFRRKWLLIGCIYLGLISGIILAQVLPKTYESYTVILVEEGKIINPLISSLAVSTAMMERMQTIQEQMLSWKSLTELTKRLNLDKSINSQYSYEQLILNLRKNIKVRLGGKNVIRISFTDKNPEKAQSVIKTITEIFINENIKMQNKETDDAVTFINDQLKVYRKKIKEGEIAQMQDDLNKLLMDSTESHPMVKDLRSKIANAKEGLDSGNFDTDETANIPINTNTGKLKQELSTLRNSLNLDKLEESGNVVGTSNEALYNMLLVDKIDSALKQDARVDESIYNKLLERLETAKITKRLDASTQGTRYTVLDPPRLPIKPTKPNKPLVVFMCLFMGIAAGIGLVLLTEFMDHSFLGIDEAKAMLNLPVLGGISRIVTVEDLASEKTKRKRVIAFSLTTGITLIVIISVVSFIGK